MAYKNLIKKNDKPRTKLRLKSNAQINRAYSLNEERLIEIAYKKVDTNQIAKLNERSLHSTYLKAFKLGQTKKGGSPTFSNVKRRYTEEEIKLIIKLHKQNYSFEYIAQKTNRTVGAIKSYCISILKLKHLDRQQSTIEERLWFLSNYKKHNTNFSTINTFRKKFKKSTLSDYTLIAWYSKLCRGEELFKDLFQNKHYISEDFDKRLIKMYIDSSLSIDDIAKILKRKPSTIASRIQYLRRKGAIKFKRRRVGSWSDNCDKQLIKLLHNGLTTIEIAKQMGFAKSTVQRHKRKNKDLGIL